MEKGDRETVRQGERQGDGRQGDMEKGDRELFGF